MFHHLWRNGRVGILTTDFTLGHWPLVMYLSLIALVAASAPNIWQNAYEKSPLPSVRDYDNYKYFTVHAPDPSDLKGFQVVEAMPIPNHWLVRVPQSLHKRAVAELANSNVAVYPEERSIIQKRAPVLDPQAEDSPQCTPVALSKRASEALQQIRSEFSIEDPLFGNQWHIFNAETPGHDMNIMGAWRLGAKGNNVTVAIVDDGLDSTHPDFQRSFDLEGSWDYNMHRQLPTPELYDDWHGTRCAGEIAADLNDACGVGVAPDAKVAGIRILSGQLEANDEARALNHHIQHNDIFSCSWGPSDDGRHMEGPPMIVQRAILNGIENGRNGLGSIYVQASGNGHHAGDNCNYDGYTNSIYSITVSSVDINNNHPFYAESCSANFVTTYSSNREIKITSSDPLAQHPDAKPQDSCTSGHTGTSASAPMAAGILALVLERRPDLSWRDLQYVVRESAVPFKIEDVDARGNWTEVEGGKLYHNDYGYGLLDAESAVRVADNWTPVGPQTWFFSEMNQINEEFTDLYTSIITVTEEDLKNSNFKSLEHVNVRLAYQYERRGALRFTLTSPKGHEVVLAEPRIRDSDASPVKDWKFSSVAHWGEDAVGDWTLKLENDGGVRLSGKMEAWQLRLWGEADDHSLVKKYSEQWEEEHGFQVPSPDILEGASPTASQAPSSTESSPNKEVNDPTAIDSAASKPTSEGDGGKPDESTENDSDKEEPKPIEPSAVPNTPEHEQVEPRHHGILFYLVCSAIGVSIILLIAVPIGYWYIKRRRGGRMPFDYSNLGLLTDDIILDDADFDVGHDSFEISDSEEPIRPEPQPLNPHHDE